MIALQIFILFICLITSSSPDSLGCPSISSIHTCSCQEKTRGLDLTCDLAPIDDIRNSVNAVSDTSQVVWYLKFRNVKLTNFPHDLLGDLRVNHFIVLNCSISSIDEDAFLGLVDDLETLDFGRNNLERVPTEALENLVNLASLNLNYNKIEILHAEAFRGLISLLRLSLFGNKIKFIDNLAFDGIGGNLTQINFGENQLSSVPSRPLRNMTVLQGLQVQDNRISAILADEFQGMGENLDVLELSNNLLEELPEKAFYNLRMLNSLDLENNKIRSIHDLAFEGIEESLEWLKLGGNQLDAIPSISLRKLVRLRQLDLRQNKIETVHEDDFKHFGKRLKFVYLQKNLIRIIEVNAFVALDSLEWLYLQSNQLTVAPYGTYRDLLDTLQILDLHENPFTCDCGIRWFRDWVVIRNTTVVNMPMETRCNLPPQLKGRTIPSVTHEDMGCVMSRAQHNKHSPLTHALIYFLIMIAIIP